MEPLRGHIRRIFREPLKGPSMTPLIPESGAHLRVAEEVCFRALYFAFFFKGSGFRVFRVV